MSVGLMFVDVSVFFCCVVVFCIVVPVMSVGLMFVFTCTDFWTASPSSDPRRGPNRYPTDREFVFTRTVQPERIWTEQSRSVNLSVRVNGPNVWALKRYQTSLLLHSKSDALHNN
uniref:Uncharacterized protein n=1 Tax=Cacopsylla melanoneura TaxID=428564 RepID=A0A8D9ENP0_9HEMI